MLVNRPRVYHTPGGRWRQKQKQLCLLEILQFSVVAKGPHCQPRACQDVIFLKLIYITCTTNQNSKDMSSGWYICCKFCNRYCERSAKPVLIKREKDDRPTLPDIKMYYQGREVKTVQQRRKNGTLVGAPEQRAQEQTHESLVWDRSGITHPAHSTHCIRAAGFLPVRLHLCLTPYQKAK